MYMYLLVEVCTGIERYRQVHAGMYMCVPCTSTYQDIPVCPGMEKVLVAVPTGMYWYIPVRTGIYWFVLVCTSTYQHVLHIFPTHKSCWNIRIQTGTCQDVLSGTLSYSLVLFWIQGSTRRYKAVKSVQGVTRQYQKVPYP